jgi:hypothetical protein
MCLYGSSPTGRQTTLWYSVAKEWLYELGAEGTSGGHNPCEYETMRTAAECCGSSGCGLWSSTPNSYEIAALILLDQVSHRQKLKVVDNLLTWSLRDSRRPL